MAIWKFSSRLLGLMAKWHLNRFPTRIGLLSPEIVPPHDKVIVVAPISAMKTAFDLKEGESFSDWKAKLVLLRDGWGSPNMMYLGPLPDADIRMKAQLNMLYSIQVPNKPHERQAWVDSKRLCRLDGEARRHLHSKLFACYSQEGFSDFEWMPIVDLQLLIHRAESEINVLRAGIGHPIASELAAAKSVKKPRSNIETKIEALEKEVAPFRDELARRTRGESATED